MLADPASSGSAVIFAKRGAPDTAALSDHRGCVTRSQASLAVGLNGILNPFLTSSSRFPLTGTSTVSTKAWKPAFCARCTIRVAISRCITYNCIHCTASGAIARTSSRRVLEAVDSANASPDSPATAARIESPPGRIKPLRPIGATPNGPLHLLPKTSTEVSIFVVSRSTRGLSVSVSMSFRFRLRQCPSSAAPST